jgi:hypothetical protein
MRTWNGNLDMNDSPDVEVWATAISTNSANGRRIIFRYAKELRPSFDRSAQPDRIIIVWKYVSANGQPNSDEHRNMDQLEDALEGALQGSRIATLALVSTGENLREWTYYTKSADRFGDLFDLATEDMPPFPIEIHTAHDPTWSMYERFRSENSDT